MRLVGFAGSLTLSLILTACAAAPGRGASPYPAIETKAQKEIAWYEAELAKRPSSHPLYAQLGRALLDRARETHDPAVLQRARTSLHRSLELQRNYEALVLLASAANFGHRFAEGKRWAQEAIDISQGVSGPDSVALALLVEGHLGLGEYDEARKLLPADGKTEDFRVAAALGQWFALRDRPDEALAAFQKAAEIAHREKVPELEAWAQIVSGGVFIDTGRAKLAAPHLAAAAKIAPDDKLLAIHRAEVEEAEGRKLEALRIYEKVLGGRGDAELSRKAWLLARELGLEKETKHHFESAQRACLRAIHAGEIYTLGELAQLWADAGVHLDQAARLAQENLRFKRDPAARNTAAQLEVGADTN